MPTKADNTIVVDRVLFAGALSRTALVSSDRARPVKLSFQNDLIRLTVNSDTSDHAVEEIDAEFTGAPFEIGFNSRFLVDALQQTGADRVSLMVHDSMSPLRIDPTPDDAEAGQAVAVVMPQRLI